MKREKGVSITSNGYIQVKYWSGQTRIRGVLQKPIVEYFGPYDKNHPTHDHKDNLERANRRAIEVRKLKRDGLLENAFRVAKDEPISFPKAFDIYIDKHVNPNHVPLVKTERGYKAIINPRSLGLKPSWKSYLTYIKKLKGYFGEMYLHEATWLDIKKMREHFERSSNPATVNKLHGVLIHLFYMMRTWRTKGEIPHYRLPDENPASSRLVKKYTETDNRRDRALSLEEYEKLLSRLAQVKDRVICHFAVKTMLRLKDLKALTHDNYDPVSRRLHGVQAKTQKRFSIPIEDRGMIAWIESRPKGKLLDFTNFTKTFQKARAEAQIGNFQFRDLRRTGASWIRARGGSRDVASKLLGHADTKMTDIYLGVEERDKAQAVAKLNDIELPIQKPEMVPSSQIEALITQAVEQAHQEKSPQ